MKITVHESKTCEGYYTYVNSDEKATIKLWSKEMHGTTGIKPLDKSITMKSYHNNGTGKYWNAFYQLGSEVYENPSWAYNGTNYLGGIVESPVSDFVYATMNAAFTKKFPDLKVMRHPRGASLSGIWCGYSFSKHVELTLKIEWVGDYPDNEPRNLYRRKETSDYELIAKCFLCHYVLYVQPEGGSFEVYTKGDLNNVGFMGLVSEIRTALKKQKNLVSHGTPKIYKYSIFSPLSRSTELYSYANRLKSKIMDWAKTNGVAINGVTYTTDSDDSEVAAFRIDTYTGCSNAIAKFLEDEKKNAPGWLDYGISGLH